MLVMPSPGTDLVQPLLPGKLPAQGTFDQGIKIRSTRAKRTAAWMTCPCWVYHFWGLRAVNDLFKTDCGSNCSRWVSFRNRSSFNPIPIRRTSASRPFWWLACPLGMGPPFSWAKSPIYSIPQPLAAVCCPRALISAGAFFKKTVNYFWGHMKDAEFSSLKCIFLMLKTPL